MRDNTNNNVGVEEPKTLFQYEFPSADATQTDIVLLVLAGNQNFGIKTGVIHMVQQSQFLISLAEDPQDHLINFVEISNTFKLHNVSDETICLRLFLFSLRDRAKTWLNSLPPGSIAIWKGLRIKFISKFFPFEKMHKRRNEIHLFAYFDGESMFEAWTRLKKLERRCPNHDIHGWMMVQIFYGGLSPSSRTLVNTAAGGSFFQKAEDEAHAILEELVYNNDQ